MTAVSIPSERSVLGSIWDVVRERRLTTGDQLPSIRELADLLEVKQTVVRDALLKAESRGLVKVLPRAGVFLRSAGPLPEQGAPATMPAQVAATDAGNTDAGNTDAGNTDDDLSRSLRPRLTAASDNVLHLLDARRLIEVELAGRAAERRRIDDLLPVRRALDAMLQLPMDAATRAEHVRRDVRFHIEVARLAGNQVLFAMQRTLLDLLVPHLDEVPNSLELHALTNRSHVAIYEAIVAGDAERARQEIREHLNPAYDNLLKDLQQPPAVMSDTHGEEPSDV